MNYTAACNKINELSGGFKPEIIVVLGSGLAGFADRVEAKTIIPYGDIPGFGVSTAPAHNGRLILGTVEGKNVACMDGRLHLYEGHSPTDLVFPLRVLRKLGADKIFLTNATGGINTSFKVGDIMLVEDHINFQGRNPLMGQNDDGLGVRFPDMTYAYNPELRKIAEECASKLGIDLKKGVYLACTGPSYETPAEIRAFRILGADAVGMSTVPEVIAAVHCGLKVLTISLITNMAAGITGNKLTHEEVTETGKKQSIVLGGLVSEIIKSC